MNQFIVNTCWFIPVYGLIGAIFSLPWAIGIIRRTGSRPAAYFNILMTLLAFFHGSIAFIHSLNISPIHLVLPWLQVADLNLSLAIEISPVSLGAMQLVTGISLLAQLYALGYMEKDWALARFFGLMGFFEGALSGIAISDSLLLSYGLLEMLTLSTYLLVGFWYAQPLVVTAARDAFLTKRVGDIILLMGLVALSTYGEGLTFSELENWAASSNLPPLTETLLGLSLIAGPLGKCAQFPLHLWLDEAMEGPNPASIMRNSVVVAAGAFVLIKLHPVFTLSPVASVALVVIGTLTAIGSSLMALAQIDIKRTLSHSTSAYLGLVFLAVGLQQIDVALLLLFTHAIAKALLFMSTGSIILTTNNQNITEMGGLWSRMPATTSAFVVGSAGLVCLLPLGTFWTMRRWVNGFWEVPAWLIGILLLVNALSALNLTRVFRLVFLGEPQPKTRRAPEIPWPMAVPMVSLIILNFLVPLILDQWQFLLSWTGPWATNARLLNQLALPLLILSGAIGCLIGFMISLGRAWARPMQKSLRFVQDFFAYDFYIEKFYRLTVVAAVDLLSKMTSWFDRYVVDGLVNFAALATVFGGQSLKYSVSGQSQGYILTIMIGVGLLLVFSWIVGN
ncbi:MULTISPECIES: NAD(P)H-quinone oxidoreductase subunit F [Planktothricoides]|uniref:NAD(P)H-quinone oxidoreductase subunit F n=2 Tax=Planktothricoides raciborskii TaxID=132608 RepID=A0AAU8JLU1_9CYAN|nr:MULTISPECIES: NAD(P)H-quinone oxidoreductase subunit F [Planktothricoides]KOR37217.1 NAD(P)H-quinone oxidoreductase subunit F [Planktothricoides sp. SR001]MBD2545712.1 NAD(P)H-quinone oxidoreductase subunit F [Planktothricoides raciborskii FACHB-1370]MBD2582716.1 NAD(P)H-quinone oxidoreductase subunit F [Planktothricoides raciborskii FACHB-1261]